MIQGLGICSEYWRTKWNRKWISKRTMPFSVVSRDPQVKAPEKTHPDFMKGSGDLGPWRFSSIDSATQRTHAKEYD